MKTDTHPTLTGDEIKTIREEMELTMVQMAHLLGYKSSRPERLRERMFDFETGKKELPAGQTRLLLAIQWIYWADDTILDRLLEHGDFLK